MPVNRRRFLIAAGALAATPAVVSCSRTPEQRPPGVPVSRFGAESTALEVTAGVDPNSLIQQYQLFYLVNHHQLVKYLYQTFEKLTS